MDVLIWTNAHGDRFPYRIKMGRLKDLFFVFDTEYAAEAFFEAHKGRFIGGALSSFDGYYNAVCLSNVRQKRPSSLYGGVDG